MTCRNLTLPDPSPLCMACQESFDLSPDLYICKLCCS